MSSRTIQITDQPDGSVIIRQDYEPGESQAIVIDHPDDAVEIIAALARFLARNFARDEHGHFKPASPEP